MRFLVYLYYTQLFYQTSTFGQNHAYCIRIFTVTSYEITNLNFKYKLNLTKLKLVTLQVLQSMPIQAL